MKTLLQRDVEQRVKDGIIPVKGFSDLGSPLGAFDSGGRATLMLMLDEGLCPGHKVLDLGCGALRVGYWIVRLLDSGNYCGIEPEGRMLKRGLEHILGDDIISTKKPRFSTNVDFNMSVFEEKFDYIYARSVWSHCARWQIEKTLDSAAEVLTPGGKLLASYLKAANPQEAFTGDDTKWKLVRHELAWLAEACRARGLKLAHPMPRSQKDLEYTISSSQTWARITRA